MLTYPPTGVDVATCTTISSCNEIEIDVDAPATLEFVIEAISLVPLTASSETITVNIVCGPTSLSDNTADTQDVTVSYDASIDPVDLGSGVPSYFNNLDSVNCPITSCVLKSADCQSAASFSEITMSTDAPF